MELKLYVAQAKRYGEIMACDKRQADIATRLGIATCIVRSEAMTAHHVSADLAVIINILTSPSTTSYIAKCLAQPLQNYL